MPVRPELEKVVWCWQGEGFEAVYGRPMTCAFLKTLTLGNHCARLVEAVGIEPYAQRYANPKRTLGYSAYRCHPQATGF